MAVVVDELERTTERTGHVHGGDLEVIALCDFCQERLWPEAGGRAVWRVDPDVHYLAVAFVHHNCAAPYLEQEGLDGSGMELGLFVEALSHNLENHR